MIQTVEISLRNKPNAKSGQIITGHQQPEMTSGSLEMQRSLTNSPATNGDSLF